MSDFIETLKDRLVTQGREAAGDLADQYLGDLLDTDVAQAIIDAKKKQLLDDATHEAQRVSLYVVGAGILLLGGWLILRS